MREGEEGREGGKKEGGRGKGGRKGRREGGGREGERGEDSSEVVSNLSVVKVQESCPCSGWCVLVSSQSILQRTELILSQYLQHRKLPGE